MGRITPRVKVLEEFQKHNDELEALLGNVISMLSQRAQDKGIALHTETVGISSHLVGDPTRLQQALLKQGVVRQFRRRGVTAVVLPVSPLLAPPR